MRIICHIAVRTAPETLAAFHAVGVELEADGLFAAFDVAEGTPLYERVQPLRHLWVPPGEPLARTEFDEGERLAARHLAPFADWKNGYPQPELDRPESPTLDFSEACLTEGSGCGVGARQVAPYRMAKAPKWGRRWLAGLFWAEDALFARRDVFERALAPLGVTGGEVLLRSGAPIPDAVQIMPTTAVPLDTSGQRTELCPVCGVTKFNLPTRTPFPWLLESSESPVFRSREPFGSGGAACHPILVSNEVYRALHGLEGRQARWEPCAEVNDPRAASAAP